MFGFERDNPGSTLVEVLVVILIVLFIGLTALVIVRSEHTKNHVSSLASKTKSEATATIPNDTPPQGTPPVKVTTTTTSGSAAPSSTSTFTIASLGIEITLPSAMSDLTYSSKTSASGQVTVNFSTRAITSAAPSCAASIGQGAFDSIIRVNGQYPSNATASEGLIKQQPSYYIAYILPTGPCQSGLSPSTQSLIDGQSQDFYSALSSIKITS